MTDEFQPKNDPRTVDELVNVTLTETDEEIVWQAISALHWRGTQEVLQRAIALCSSQCRQERHIGADILGQLGVPERTFPKQCCGQLRSMLKQDENADVLRAVIIGLSHQYDGESVPLIAQFAPHPDPEIRYAVAFALSGHQTPLAITSLISLSRDPDPDVRDWATFALGTQIELDTPEIREALAARIDDPDDDTRGEALVGLAQRNDPRVVPALKRELTSDCIGTLAIEAAELIASKELHPQLVALRDWWDVDSELLEGAISASQP